MQMPAPEGSPEEGPTSQGQAQDEPSQCTFSNVRIEGDIFGAIGTGVNRGRFESCVASGCTVAVIGPTNFNGMHRILASGVINSLPIPAKFNRT